MEAVLLAVAVDQPIAGIAGGPVGPQHVGDAVAAEVADAGHGVRRIAHAVVMEAGDLATAVGRPVAGIAGGLVGPQHVRDAVAVEIVLWGRRRLGQDELRRGQPGRGHLRQCQCVAVAEIDDRVVADLRRESKNLGKRTNIGETREVDLVAVGFQEVGDRVGAIAGRENEGVGAGATGQRVVAGATCKAVVI